MKILNLALILPTLILTGCCTTPLEYSGVSDDTPQFKVNFSVAEMKKCDLKTANLSEISVDRANIPTNTSFLKLVIKDITIGYPHGITLLPYDHSESSDSIGLRPFRFQPFCPPPFSSHKYQLTVYALDKDYNVTAYGQVENQFPE